ncbi:MAG: endonuclease/exonuclease/phosphatase family protein [Acidimicrobiia bacterium]|nr:endonuclease/exonuclease/phosphatase family protein [Acidimicrobiia bacterium]
MKVLVGLVALVVVAAGCSDSDSPHGDRQLANVHVVSQNILHGEACPADSDKCHLPDRVAFFSEQIATTCPDIVALQEANQRIVEELTKDVKTICDGAYHVVWDRDPGTDREVVLTKHPVLAQQRFRLAGPLRTALWVRVATDAGAVDFWTAHLASGSDDRPCDRDTCPKPCQVKDMLNTCQGRELGELAYARRAPDSPLILAGDFNATPDAPTLRALKALGLEDTHLAARNPECDPTTGRSCTGGRDDTSVAGLSDPRAKQKERIDYVLLDPPSRCHLGKPTGLFEEAAATGRKDGLAHPSDHTGVQATIACETTAAQKAAGAKATTSSTTSTTSAVGTIDRATKQAVSAAFEAVFSGTSDLDTRVAAIEDGESVRSVVASGFAANQAIASRISVKIHDVTLHDATHADVTFSLLLDGNAVLDHLPGQAVEVGGSWFITKRSFCDVGTQGMKEIPAACQ